MSERPVIGHFRSKPGNTPRANAPERPAAPSDEKAGEVSSDAASAEPATPSMDLEVRDTETPDSELTPVERYRKRLGAAKISLADAAAIYDAVLEKGYYEEYVRIRDHRAVFRTRQYEDQLRLQTALEAREPRTALAHDEIVSRFNLAASLHEWMGRALPHKTSGDFDAVLRLIERMPQPLVALLYDALAKFDYRVMLVFSEGATDSF